MCAAEDNQPLPVKEVVSRTCRELLSFVRSPVPPAGRQPLGRTRAIALLTVLGIDICIVAVFLIAVFSAEAAGAAIPATPDFGMSPLFLFLFATTVAPVLEEVIFRGWLSGRKADLEFAGTILGLTAVTVAGFALFSGGTIIWLSVFAIGAVAAWLRWGVRRKTHQAMPGWFARHYAKIVYLSSVAFGTVHLTNYDTFSAMHLVMVLPQTIGGLLLAFTRTRLGLSASIVQHALFNALVFGADLAFGS